MSSDAEQEYFSDGISEELLNLLAKIPELRVIARTSSFAYKGKDIQIADVARELKVAHVLEGSVRKAGNRVRITAQLIRASDSTHLWSETYDRSLEDIFAVQDEISAKVVEQLKIILLGAAPVVRETNPAAYAFYLQARHLDEQRTPESWAQAIALYRQALEIAPEYAAAWNYLGGVYQNQAARGLRPAIEGLGLAREAVNKALAIDPNYAPAHSLLGWLAMYFDNDLEAAARHYERALALEPGNLDSLHSAATLLTNLGRMEPGITLQRYVLSRDPVNLRTLGNLGLSLVAAGRPDEALEPLRTVIRLSPGNIGTQTTVGSALLLKNEPVDALAAMQQEPFKDAGLAEIPMQIEFANLHDDPRWLPFLESIGKSPAQLDAIEFEVTLPN